MISEEISKLSRSKEKTIQEIEWFSLYLKKRIYECLVKTAD